jgi:hypothetical protein
MKQERGQPLSMPPARFYKLSSELDYDDTSFQSFAKAPWSRIGAVLPYSLMAAMAELCGNDTLHFIAYDLH